LLAPARPTFLCQIRHRQCQIGYATRSIEVFALASLCAPLYATLRQLISLVDSIRVVLFLIVPVSQTGAPLFIIKTEPEKTCANFARAPLGSQLVVQRRSRKWPSDRSWTRIKQVAHRGALPLDNCHTQTELYTTKNDTGLVFLSWFAGLAIWHQEPKFFFAPMGMIQLPLGDELFLVSRAAPIRTRETRCAENRRFSDPAIPPPVPTPRCAGTSGDRPDLPADDWTAPCTAEPVTAAAIELVVGSFAGAGAAMRSDSIAPQQEQKN
jgi:hypothetical protein